ncbi:hypothetical protein MATR_29900 [Marivirga tractuosa]|uniref:Uncharacterized protein n=1 Tax=Marivirga tractuosa (strain ATCC 23168 / DSM 4126 / NBRC 15989 / NCIMB 1408 / VKM B-1430 / H-43) TaxID=643867 RepID=E4TV96_MARTH|nr:hypothetical protein Ftrac_3187 [Marivirga tractuosa DSM 4126]BDD16165.1 hypothetical protein MATR_29900 [Marivirga tractuosa]
MLYVTYTLKYGFESGFSMRIYNPAFYFFCNLFITSIIKAVRNWLIISNTTCQELIPTIINLLDY